MGRRRAARALGLALSAALAASGGAAAQTPAVAAAAPSAAAGSTHAAWPDVAEAAAAALARGDAAYALRHEGADEVGRARREPIARAVAAYSEAIGMAPDALAPRWRLVRALYFAGDFASRTPAESDAALELATAESESAKDALAARVGGRAALAALEPTALRAALAPADLPDAAALHLWSAIAWASWGRERGLVGAVREGLAGRIHRDAQVALALDERVEEGGAHRLMSRLHATLPRIPFLSPWVDRAEALPEIERALALAPAHPANRMFYAQALLELAPARRAEALALLATVADLEPRASDRSEDLAIRARARETLAEEGAPGA